MKADTSHRQILRSSSIIGGAAVFNIAGGLIKTKFVAILLGPSGVGLTVLLQNVIQTVVAIAGLSLNSVGTRQIAEAVGTGREHQTAVARRALLWAAGVLAIVGSLAFLLVSPWTAASLAEGKRIGGPVAWLALGIALSIIAQGQSALLTGHRRIGDLARLSILSVNVAAAIGIAAVLIWGDGGILIFVLAPFAVTAVAGQFYLGRLPVIPVATVTIDDLKKQWAVMLRLGGALTVAATAVTGGQLAARVIIERELGAGAVGYFQASWLVSVTYIGFVLQAMGTDFYPRVTAAFADVAAANTLVNEQTEVALLLGAPVLLGTLGAAPWIVPLLYSRSFDPAVHVLQFQVLGDVLKIASWPLGFLLLASGAGQAFMICEIVAIGVMLAVMASLLPIAGLEASGIAVVAMYLAYLPCVYAVAWRRTGFRWSRLNLGLLGALVCAAATTLAVSRMSQIGGGLLGVLLAMGAGGLCLWRLRDALPGPLAAIVAWFGWRLGRSSGPIA